MAVVRIGPVIAAAASALLLAALVPASAPAEPVHQFSFQLVDVTADGRFTAVFATRAFDTTGAPPPAMDENTVRLPAGLELRREFRRRQWWCDGRALIDAITAGKPHRQRWVRAFSSPGPVLRRLARLGTRADRRLIKAARTCTRALIGRGRATVDARPAIAEEIPADVFLYLARPRPGAIATIAAVGIPDPRAPIVRRNPILADVRSLVSTSLVSDPSADGRFGLKLVLPTGRISGFQVSLARLELRVPGLTVRRGGRTVFWMTRPTCPASGLLTFEAFYGYPAPLEDVTRTFTLPCPRYG